MERSREQTAIHEAGHAVAALSFGIPMISATVVPGRNDHTRTVWGKEWGDTPRTVKVKGNPYLGQVTLGRGERRKRRWGNYAIMTLCGPLAEIELLGGTSESLWRIHVRQARTYMRRTTPPARLMREHGGFRDVAIFAWGDELLAVATRLVETNRDAIRRVADALIERETLSGEDVALLVRSAA